MFLRRMETIRSLANPRKVVSIITGPVHSVSQSLGTKAECFFVHCIFS